MGRLGAALVVMGWTAGAAQADVPVKIASVPDGPIKLGVSEDAREWRRTFRLVPQAAEQVKIDQVRVVDCTSTQGQSCAARVEPGECAGGCVLTAIEPGSVTVVVTLPAPGTYTSSLEIVYVKEQKPPPDNKVQVVKAVLATVLEVTRPAPAIQPMKVTITGPTGADVDLAIPRRSSALLRLHVQDDEGLVRELAQVVPAPLVRKSGNDTLVTDADVHVFVLVDGKRKPVGGGVPLALPAAGAAFEIEVSDLGVPGKYEGKLRLLAPWRAPQEVAYTITVRDGIVWPIIMIACGALSSFLVQWWVGKRRARLVHQKSLERLRDRLEVLERRGGLADRDRRLIDALLRELEDKLYQLADGDALAADVLVRFSKRVDLADVLIRIGQDVERLPLAARSEPRRQLDAHSIAFADQAADDTKLKEIERALLGIAGASVRRAALAELLAALEAAVGEARDALSPELQARLTTEVEPALRDAHAAADRDRVEELDRALELGRSALAKVQGAALLERLPETPPRWFGDPSRYAALRGDMQAKLAALQAVENADDAVRQYENALARLASAWCDAAARWCRGQAAGKPAEIRARLLALASEAEAARSKPAADALALADRVMRDSDELTKGPQAKPTSASTRTAASAAALVAIPALPSSPRERVRRARRLIALGDRVVLVTVTLVAIATGLKLLWVGSPTWGGWGDWLTAILWGAGLHAIGNESFKGLLGLTRELGKVE